MSCTRRAVTLIELLVALAVLGLLGALLMPAVQSARESSHRAACQNNLKQIGLALQLYHEVHHAFPPGYTTQVNPSDRDDLGPGWGWAALILPHLERGEVFAAINLTKPIEDAQNENVRLTSLRVYTCPSDADFQTRFNVPDYETGSTICGQAASNYVASVGTVRQTCKRCRDYFDGVFGRNSRMQIKDIPDGTSKTFAVGERCHSLSTPTWAGVPKHSMVVDHLKEGKVAAGPAYVLGTTFLHGNEEELEVRSRETVAEIFGSQHPGVMNFALCDGSVTTIALEIDDVVFQQWSTRRGEIGAGGVIHATPLPETPATPAADAPPQAPENPLPSAR